MSFDHFAPSLHASVPLTHSPTQNLRDTLDRLKGYECTRILNDNLLIQLKGLKTYKAEAALKRKMYFPLFITIKV